MPKKILIHAYLNPVYHLTSYASCTLYHTHQFESCTISGTCVRPFEFKFHNITFCALYAHPFESFRALYARPFEYRTHVYVYVYLYVYYPLI